MKIFFPLITIIILLSFISCAQKSTKEPLQKNVEESNIPISENKKIDTQKLSVACFAGGCFWCTEGVCKSIKGVKYTEVGFSGGKTENTNYDEVSSGKTGHAEAIQIYYDSTIIKFKDLLEAYFASGDPTQVNGQGPDNGSQYRSIIFYRTDKEKKEIEYYINFLNISKIYNKPIAVEIVPFKKFWIAEEYHQNFVEKNPNNGYVESISIPRIKEFHKKRPDLIKPEKKLEDK